MKNKFFGLRIFEGLREITKRTTNIEQRNASIIINVFLEIEHENHPI